MENRNVEITEEEKKEIIKKLEIIVTEKDETQAEYENEIVTAFNDVINYKDLDIFMKSVIEDSSRPEPLRFACFFGLSSYYRRRKSYDLNKEFINKYKDKVDIANHKITNHLMLLEKISSIDPNNFASIIVDAKINKDNLPLHAGALHAYADIVSRSAINSLKKVDLDVLKDALKSVDEAINKNPLYAKYHCTKGTLLSLVVEKNISTFNDDTYKIHNTNDDNTVIQMDFSVNEKFEPILDEARDCIRKAINLEKEDSNDYPIRISNYQYALNNVSSVQRLLEFHKLLYRQRKEMNEMTKKHEKYEDEMKSAQTKYIELLGIFSTIITFTISTVAITGDIGEKSISGIYGMIMLAFGLALVVYTCLIGTINKVEKSSWLNVSVVVSLLIIIASIIILIN